jgi:hypothetical protein
MHWFASSPRFFFFAAPLRSFAANEAGTLRSVSEKCDQSRLPLAFTRGRARARARAISLSHTHSLSRSLFLSLSLSRARSLSLSHASGCRVEGDACLFACSLLFGTLTLCAPPKKMKQEEGWGLSEEVLSKLGVAHDATLGAPPRELPPHAALHTPPSDTPTPTHPHTHTHTHISPRATPPAAESTATLELHAEVVHQRHEQSNAPVGTTSSTHARTHARTHEHAADASTPAAREEGDRVTSWRTCEGRHADEGCYRWRRKSVYAVVAWDALGRGHVLARWQRWHQVLYDDVFAP